MKVKSSRGIAMKLICCAALVVLSSAVAFSATPTSGALLTIDGTAGTTAVHVKIYDSQIHSGTVQAAPTCGVADQVPTDAYVLQGGSATGCDTGDDFEVTEANNPNAVHQAFGHTDIWVSHRNALCLRPWTLRKRSCDRCCLQHEWHDLRQS